MISGIAGAVRSVNPIQVTFCLCLLLFSKGIGAVVFAVDRIDDDPTATNCHPEIAIDCSFSGAVTAANLTPGPDIINVPAGEYEQSQKISITDSVEIIGTGETPAIILPEPGVQTLVMETVGPGLEVTLRNLVIEGGVHNWTGGLWLNGGTFLLDECIIRDNTANGPAELTPLGSGMAIYDAQVTLLNTTITGNEAIGPGLTAAGGGIYVHSNSSLKLIQSSVTLNHMTTRNGRGGGIYSAGSVEILQGSVISNNELAVSEGELASYGGGIYLHSDGLLVLKGSTVAFNSVSGPEGRGGGIFAAGTVTIAESTIHSNSVGQGDTYGFGGGAYFLAGAEATIERTSFIANYTAQEGAGINVQPGATVYVSNSTFYGNNAGTFGGAITNDGSLTLENVTVSGNSALNAGDALMVSGSGTVFANSIIRGACGSILGSFNSVGGNVESPGDTCSLNEASDQTNVSNEALGLDPTTLQNGGPTLTMALMEGSAAIDAGFGDCPPVDQRRWLRTDGQCDSGAYEFDAEEPGPVMHQSGFEAAEAAQ